MGKKDNKYEPSTVDITLTADERNKLRGKASELLKMYLLINELRDFETNIAGLVTWISDRTFKEGMEVKGTGVKKWRPSTTHIQRWIKQLENLGLIEHRGNYVFYCPLASQKKTETKISHQGVTNHVTTGVTKQEDDKTPINIDSAGDLKSKVSPEVSPEVSKRLYTPLLVTVTDPISAHVEIFGVFKNLLNDQGYRPEQILNSKTIAMIKAWIEAGITIDEAKTGIEIVNARQGIPGHPSYYLKPVMQVKSDFKAASQSVNEATNAKCKSAKAAQQRPKSTTQSFWDDTTEALERHYGNNQLKD